MKDNSKNRSHQAKTDAIKCKHFEHELLDPSTPRNRLEAICMTLAHMDNREAQGVLERFKQSARAGEVKWLDCAIEEGRFNYLEPRNEREERDYLALKMVQEMTDRKVNLEIELGEARLNLRKWSIEEAAVFLLIRNGCFEKLEKDVAHDVRVSLQSRAEHLEKEVAHQGKIIDCIHESISTARYLEVDLEEMRSIHYT